MKTAAFLCSAAIPFVILTVLCFGLLRRVNVFDSFTAGAKDGLKTAVSIIPPVTALMVAIAMLRASGAIDALGYLLRPITSVIGLDENLLPLALLRPISGSGSVGLVNDIVSRFGADSAVAKTACVMAGATETTFYTLAVYFGAAGIKKTRHTVAAALFADVSAIVICLFVCNIFFNK